MKNTLVDIVRKARENFMSEDDAKKLANSFEEEAKKTLEAYLQEHPNAAFSATFTFFIDFSHLDVINHKCKIDSMDVWSTIPKHYEPLDPEKSKTVYVSDDEGDRLQDGLQTRALKKFFRELENRGYSIGYDDGTEIPIVVYFSVGG